MSPSALRSAAWLIRPDLAPVCHTIREWHAVLTADFAAMLAPAGLAHMPARAT